MTHEVGHDWTICGIRLFRQEDCYPVSQKGCIAGEQLELGFDTTIK